MDMDKIKNFFIFHVEKIILLVVVMFAGFLIYSGLGMPLYTDKHQPEELSADATQVRRAIEVENHNENILPERVETIFDIVARTEDSQRPVAVKPYSLENPWTPGSLEKLVRREDPVLPPPRELYAQGQLVTIAVRSTTGEYPLAELEPADAVEIEDQRQTRGRRQSRRERAMGGYGGGEYGGGEYGGGGYGEGMEGAGAEGYGEGSGLGSGMMPGGYGPGSSMAARGSGRKLDLKYDFGLRPKTTQSSGGATQQPVPAVGWFIAGTAVMPHKEAVEAYQAALEEAEGYDPRRDRPQYYNFEVQRADVTNTAVEDLTEDDWVLRGSRLKYLRDAISKWSGFSPEIVPLPYRDQALTTYIPPVLLDDYRQFSVHPLIPLTIDEKNVREAIVPALDQFEEGELELAVPGARGGISSGGGVSSYGPPGGMGAPDYGMSGYEGGYGGESGSYGGGSSSYGGYGSMAIEPDPVDYKIMRFYDFADGRDKNSPRPNRRYVYRLRIAVIDPNFPSSPAMQPENGTLSAEVYRRIASLKAAERKAKERTPEMFQRWSEWSNPSAPASLPDQETYFAGPVSSRSTKEVSVGNRTVEFERDPPTAKMVTTKYDFAYQTRIPFWIDVTEGSVLSHQGDADVIDPLTLEIKKLPDAEITSGTTVIDLNGGKPLEITEGEELTEPARMLLFDEKTGALTVSGEVSDHESYRIYSYADEREPGTGTRPGPGTGPPVGPPSGYPGYPGP